MTTKTVIAGAVACLALGAAAGYLLSAKQFDVHDNQFRVEIVLPEARPADRAVEEIMERRREAAERSEP